jgi:hypothetical protein
MRLREVKQTAGFQEVGDDLRPATDVRQPPDRSPGDEYGIEGGRLRDCRRRIIEVSLNEAGSVGEAQLICEPTSRKNRGWHVEEWFLALRGVRVFLARRSTAAFRPTPGVQCRALR